MAIQISTALRNHIAVDGSVRGALNGLVIKLYSGTVPSSADAAISGDSTLLCTISTDGSGAGLNFETSASGGVLTKASADTWEGTVAETGTATYYRFCTTGDSEGSSTSAIRVQGTVGTVNSDLLLSSTGLTSSAVQRLGYYSLTIPAQ